ncbi:hypothetical protein EIP86_002046 [Pleurotus ostreatoroseus]|nr:hypothetical protein EIP86_002046 [Pleurotus ostreatoroseus]
MLPLKILPLEVYERAIDATLHLKTSENSTIENARLRRTTLLACALTCKAWLFRSRYHLHREVQIFDKCQLDRFVAVLRNEPNIGQFVRTFVVGSRPQAGKVKQWAHLIPLYLAEFMHGLKVFIVNGCDWRVLHPSFLMKAAKFVTVTKLVMHTVKLGTSRELTKLVFSFPNLRELTVQDTQCAKNRPCQLFKNARRCLPLEFLFFRRALLGYFMLELLGETGSNASIHSLELEFATDTPEIETICDFIKGCASLRFAFLQVPLGVDKVELDVYKSLSLSNAICLRRLKFSSNLSPSIFSLLVQMLRTAPIGAITDIFILFWTEWTPSLEQKIKALEAIDWTPLDNALSATRYKALEHLCIQVVYMRGLSALPTFLEQKLPKLHKKGVLIDELDIERYYF